MLPLKKALSFLLYPALGLLAGWASVTGMSKGRETEKKTAAASSGRDREARDARPAMQPGAMFFRLREQLEEGKDITSSSIVPLLEGWTDEEMRKALDEAVKEPDALLRYSSMAGLLFREYAKRDMHAAMDWMLGQTEVLKIKFAPMWSAAQPDDRALEVLDFYRHHRDFFPGFIAASFITGRAAQQVSAQGPAAVAELLKRSVDDGTMPNNGIIIKFPERFDFAGLLSSPDFQALGLSGMEWSIMQAWKKQDREGAFSWEMEKNGVKGLATAYRPFGQSPDETRWFVGKLSGLTLQQQDDYFDNAVWTLTSRDMNYKEWTEGAAPSVREKIIATGAKALFLSQEDRTDLALRAIETLPDVEARLRLLETQDPPSSLNPRVIVPMPEKEAANLLAALARWGVDTPRAEAIVKRYTSLPAHP
jgi:hypothetical protein